MKRYLVTAVLAVAVISAPFMLQVSNGWLMSDGLIACDPIIEDYHINKIQVTNYQDSSHMPAEMFDTDNTSYWADESATAILQIGLTSKKTVCSTDIAFHLGDQRTNQFKVEVSTDGINWIKAYEGTSSGTTKALQHFIFNNKYHNISELRYTFQPTPKWTSILELRIDLPNPDRYAFEVPGNYIPTNFNSITSRFQTGTIDDLQDNFGTANIYPTKAGGNEWHVNMNSPANDSLFRNLPSMTKQPDGSWQVSGSNGGQVRLEAWSPANEKWLNVEITAYAKIVSSTNPLIQLYSRGGHHSSNSECDGSAYKARLYFNEGRAAWVKEVTHPAYAGNRGTVDVTDNELINKWVGFKAVMYNVIDADSGKTYVQLESYIDDTVDNNGNLVINNNWKLASKYKDTGGWGSSDSDFDSTCPPLNKDSTEQYRQRDEIFNTPGNVGKSANIAAWRSDGTTWNFKYLSAREIEPPKPPV